LFTVVEILVDDIPAVSERSTRAYLDFARTTGTGVAGTNTDVVGALVGDVTRGVDDLAKSVAEIWVVTGSVSLETAKVAEVVGAVVSTTER
jgi:hypothetical protein